MQLGRCQGCKQTKLLFWGFCGQCKQLYDFARIIRRRQNDAVTFRRTRQLNTGLFAYRRYTPFLLRQQLQRINSLVVNWIQDRSKTFTQDFGNLQDLKQLNDSLGSITEEPATDRGYASHVWFRYWQRLSGQSGGVTIHLAYTTAHHRLVIRDVHGDMALLPVALEYWDGLLRLSKD